MAGHGDEGRLVADRYRLVERIGRGGMGTVWLAEDELLGRQVAVKKLHPPQPHMDDEELATLFERTRREARAAARISHPNVVVVHDVVDDEGLPSIVMEYVPSVTLGERLKSDGAQPPAEAARIGRGMLAALRAAHRAGVLHRDVKPGNVLLGVEGAAQSGGRVVLTDFGIAQASGTSTLTRTGELIGSIDFLSPERIRGGAPGPEADLWALGATLYQAVEGISPFRRPTAIETAYAIAEEPVEPPAHAGALAEVIDGLLAKEPQRRLSMDEAERLLRIPASEQDTAVVEQPGHSGQFGPGGSPYAGGPSYAGGQPYTGSQSYTGGSPYTGGQSYSGSQSYPGGPTGGQNGGRTGGQHGAPTYSGSHSYPGGQPYPGGPPPAQIPPQQDTAPTHAAMAPATTHAAPPGPRRSRRRAWIAAVAAVVVLAGGGAFAAQQFGGDTGTEGDHHTTGPTTPVTTPPTTAPSTPPTTPPTTPAWTPPAVPQGYHLARQPDHGYSVPVPDGWTKEVHQNGDEVDYLDPSKLVGLKISALKYASGDPYQNWLDLEPQTRRQVDGYHRERMVPTTLFGGQKAALWMFTFKGTARDWEAADMGFGKEGGTDFAIYLSAPKAQWEQWKPVFDNAVAGFRQSG
jgi:serine/threonine protein kinase